MFCGKSVLRLALVHSKYTGHGKITIIRTHSAKSKVPAFKFFWDNLAETLLFWKWLYQIQFALKIFRYFTGKSSSPLIQSLALQKSLPLDVECVNFPNIFQNTYFHKALLRNCFCISLHYVVFEKITFLISRWKFFMMWKSNWQLHHEWSNAIKGDLHVIYNDTKDNLT